jgi:hypothetical protein
MKDVPDCPHAFQLQAQLAWHSYPFLELFAAQAVVVVDAAAH